MAEAHESAGEPGVTTAQTGIQPLEAPVTGIQVDAPANQPAVTPPLAYTALKRPHAGLTPLDLFLGALLLVLTFFVASFTVFHADIWMHLASGRLVAGGAYQFGVDPFAYTTANAFWVNQSWLFDWLSYVIFSLVGGEGLVVCKALLLVILALVLVDVRRLEQSLWLPLILTGMAMLALSTNAFLRPATVSFLLLGVTIHWLVKSMDGAGQRRLWLLPPLFALWVNLDAWFILGPITIFLFWLGALVDGWTGRPGLLRPAILGKVLLVGLAACMLNPHHFRAFALPPELATLIVSMTDSAPSWLVASGQTMQQIRQVDPQFMNWLSPLSAQYLSQPGQGYNLAGLAYFLLLLLGLASFLLPLTRGPWNMYRLLPVIFLALVAVLGAVLIRRYLIVIWFALPLVGCTRGISYSRFFVWLFFALLSLLLARMIPFFAVVGGPIALLNFQDFFAQVEVKPSPGVGRLRLCGRLATTLAFLGLLFLAWPGWLHGPLGDFQSQRRVAWGIHIDPSLYLTAYHLGELKEEGKIRQGFSLSPDVACYCSWFAPEVKGFIDYRFDLFSDVAQTFAKVRKALWQEAQETMMGRKAIPKPDFSEWRDLAAAHDINFLVLTNFERVAPTRLLVARLWLEKKKWPVLYEDGRTLVFGWTDSNPADRRLTQDSPSRNRQAFSQVPADEQVSPVGNDFPAVDRGFWRKYFLGREGIPLPSSKAYLDHFEHRFLGEQWERQYGTLLRATVFCSPWAFSVVAPATSLWGRDAGPPADPVLMVRHARLGAAAADHNPQAYRILSDAFKTLWKSQEDHWSLGRGQGAPLRTSVRQIQTIAALKTYLVLFPEDHTVHEALAEMYLQLHYFDVAWEHFSLALRYVDRLRRSGSTRKEFDNYKKNLERNVRILADEVKQRRADFDLRTAGLGPLEKFSWALQRPYKPLDLGNRARLPWYNKFGVDPQGFGLANLALNELLQARIEKMDKAQLFQLRNNQLYLLLALGRLQEVQEALPLHKNVLGPYYSHYLLLWAAAVGNYHAADEALAEQINNLAAEKHLSVLHGIYCVNLAPSMPSQSLALRAWILMDNQNAAHILLQKAGELHLMRGLLALEKGDVELAAGYFRKSLSFMGANVFFPDRPIAQRYLELIRDQAMTNQAQFLLGVASAFSRPKR